MNRMGPEQQARAQGRRDSELKWARRFIELSAHIAQWSKDPSTKTGAVIVRPDRTIASVGYNGFPRGIADTQELLTNREEKYRRVIHCEMNAIMNAREPLAGYSLYEFPGCSCERCAVHVIQAGITAVYYPTPTEDFMSRWGESVRLSQALFTEAGVRVVEVKL